MSRDLGEFVPPEPQKILEDWKVYKFSLACKADSCYTEGNNAMGMATGKAMGKKGGISCSRKFFVHCWHP
jgi:hypothetical protein